MRSQSTSSLPICRDILLLAAIRHLVCFISRGSLPNLMQAD